MKQNKYDEDKFFKKYIQMDRSIKGLAGAGEWQTLKKMLPDFTGKRVLDLGCGLGWHCKYAADNGAVTVVGIDISEKMLNLARKKNTTPSINYNCLAVEDIDFPPDSFDIVISSLAFHYIKDFEKVCISIRNCLSKGGDFVFSVEHPIFTASEHQQWYTNEKGQNLHWPVDNYFFEGKRRTIFLGEEVIKYHKTLTTYLNTLIKTGFEITQIVEPTPPEEMLEDIKSMTDELRRPMMLLVSAKRK